MNHDDLTTVERVGFREGSIRVRPDHARADALSGRYRGRTSAFELELRVAIDRAGPMTKVSGDFYPFPGATTASAASFIVHAPTLTVTPTEITIRGLSRFAFNVGFPVVQVIMERRPLPLPLAPAVVQFFSQSNTLGATYVCAFESAPLQPLLLEAYRVLDATPLEPGSWSRCSARRPGLARWSLTGD